MTPQALARRLRERRTPAYVNLMKSLDVGGHLEDRQRFQALIDAVHAELPEVSVEQLPLGIVARCYLGTPYEVHTVDFAGLRILHHYKVGESLPAALDPARALAAHASYEFIEVYSDCLRAVHEDGTVSVVGGGTR